MIQICSECSGTEIECSAERCWGFVNGKRKDAPQVNVTFPQPEVEAPKVGVTFYFVSAKGSPASDVWGDAPSDFRMLENSNVYLCFEHAHQRAAWNKQEMAQRVKPKWLRDLGPEIQRNTEHSGWLDVIFSNGYERWGDLDPSHYRAKPKPAPDVVVTVNGREYRWPATVKEGEPKGVRYGVHLVGWFGVAIDSNSYGSGPRVHHTREGAEAQCAALNAALGVEQ